MTSDEAHTCAVGQRSETARDRCRAGCGRPRHVALLNCGEPACAAELERRSATAPPPEDGQPERIWVVQHKSWKFDDHRELLTKKSAADMYRDDLSYTVVEYERAARPRTENHPIVDAYLGARRPTAKVAAVECSHEPDERGCCVHCGTWTAGDDIRMGITVVVNAPESPEHPEERNGWMGEVVRRNGNRCTVRFFRDNEERIYVAHHLNRLTRRSKLDEADSDDGDPSNMRVRAGYLRALATKLGAHDRLMVERASRSLMLAASAGAGRESASPEEVAALRTVAEKARAIELVWEHGRPVIRGAAALDRSIVQLDKVAPQIVTADCASPGSTPPAAVSVADESRQPAPAGSPNAGTCLVDGMSGATCEKGTDGCIAHPEAADSSSPAPSVRDVVAWMRATYPQNQHAREWADEIARVFLKEADRG